MLVLFCQRNWHSASEANILICAWHKSRYMYPKKPSCPITFTWDVYDKKELSYLQSQVSIVDYAHFMKDSCFYELCKRIKGEFNYGKQ